MAGTASPPSSTTGSVASKQRRLNRSCVLCHQRKIRCDKNSPCGNCRRGDLLCQYPEAEQPVRRPHRTTINDIAARLARLERIVSAIAKSSPGMLAGDSLELASAIDAKAGLHDADIKEGMVSPERLIQGDSSSRYINESLLSHILEEVCKLTPSRS